MAPSYNIITHQSTSQNFAKPLDSTLGYTGYKPKYADPKTAMHEYQAIPNRNTRFYVPGYQGYVPQVKAENVFGQSYAKTTGLARQGMIETKANDSSHNHWDNFRAEDKYRSTFNENFKNQIVERQKQKPADILKPGFDTFEFESSEYKMAKQNEIKQRVDNGIVKTFAQVKMDIMRERQQSLKKNIMR